MDMAGNSTVDVTSSLDSIFKMNSTSPTFPHHKVYGSVALLLVIFVIPVTSVLLIAILSSREMRNSLRHLIIASVNVTQFLLAMFYYPLVVGEEFRLLTSFNCYYRQFATTYSRIISVFVTCWSLVVLHGHFLTSVFYQKLPLRLSAFTTSILRVVVAISPWLFMFLILPGLLSGYAMELRNIYKVHNITRSCILLNFSYYEEIQNLILFFPMAIAAILCIGSLVAHVLRKKGILGNNFQLMSQPSPQQDTPLVSILATIVTLFCLFPYFIHNRIWHLLYDIFDENHWYLSFIMEDYLSVLKTLNSLALTLIWLADSSLRTRLKILLCRCKLTRSNSTAEISITYKDLVASDQGSVSESHPP